MPTWKTSSKDQPLSEYSVRVLCNAIRGLSVTIREISSSPDIGSDDCRDLVFVSTRIQILLGELETRMGDIDDRTE